jgi:Tfp pilus assembly protein PilF
MTRPVTRARSLALRVLMPASLVLLALASCASPQQHARAQATQRWNQARAQVKAKLAADQFAAGNVQAAASDLAEADRLTPNNPDLVALRARIWLAAGETARAAELLEQTHLVGKAQAEIEYLLGVVRQQQQRWDEALAAYLRAVQIDDGEVAYVVAAVQAWLQLGQPGEAQRLLTGVASRFSWTNAFQAALAECHEQAGDWPAAAAAWQRVVGEPEAEADLHERFAVALYRAGRYAEAIPVLLETLKPEDADSSGRLRVVLAECYLQAGQNAAARDQVQLVLQRERENVRAWRLLARILAAAGEYAPALRAAQRALGIDERDLNTRELLVALAWRAGDEQLAASSAARLLELDAQNPVAQRILQRPADRTASPGTH